MILRFAWRNLWRWKTRSLILITSVVIGYFSMFLFYSIDKGAIQQAIDNIIDSGVGHLQIHAKGYTEDPDIKRKIPDPQGLFRRIQSPQVEYAVARVDLSGIISSAEETRPVKALGGRWSDLKISTNFPRYIEKGKFPEKENQILMGRELAELLRVSVGDRVVITSSTATGELSSYGFRVSGIFHTPSLEVNKYVVLISMKAAKEIAGYKDEVNGIFIKLKKPGLISKERDRLKKLLGGKYEVLSWDEVFPVLKYEMEALSQLMLLFGFIILLGAAFGIAEVFFMSIYERMREIGMLRALGVSPGGITKIILGEAFLLSSLSVAAGLLLSTVFYIYLSYHGINLAIFSRSLEVWGAGSVIYPLISPWEVIELVLMVYFVVFLSVVFPLRKARKITPAEGLRYV